MPCAKSGRRAIGHDPAGGAISSMLRSLKMHGMAQAVGELTEQGSPAFEAALLSQFLKAETVDREVRSTPYQANIRPFASRTIAILPASTSSAARSPRRCCASSTDASS
jgi:hypothetical protein